jgi:hypothetical protein
LQPSLAWQQPKKKILKAFALFGKVDLPVFLQQKLEKKTGHVVEIPADLKAYSRLIPEPSKTAFASKQNLITTVKDGNVSANTKEPISTPLVNAKASA